MQCVFRLLGATELVLTCFKATKLAFAFAFKRICRLKFAFSNICTKNYWNRATTVTLIVGGWGYTFFRDTVYNVYTLCLKKTSKL